MSICRSNNLLIVQIKTQSSSTGFTLAMVFFIIHSKEENKTNLYFNHNHYRDEYCTEQLRNYIRDPSDVFSISSPEKILMMSLLRLFCKQPVFDIIRIKLLCVLGLLVEYKMHIFVPPCDKTFLCICYQRHSFLITMNTIKS